MKEKRLSAFVWYTFVVAKAPEERPDVGGGLAVTKGLFGRL